MSDDITIGSAQAGSMAIGGKGTVIRSGHLEIHNDPAGGIAQLRVLVSDLQRLAAQNSASPEVQADVTAAVDEVTQAAPDVTRLRALMTAVQSGVAKVGPLAEAAASIITLIGGIEGMIH